MLLEDTGEGFRIEFVVAMLAVLLLEELGEWVVVFGRMEDDLRLAVLVLSDPVAVLTCSLDFTVVGEPMCGAACVECALETTGDGLGAVQLGLDVD